MKIKMLDVIVLIGSVLVIIFYPKLLHTVIGFDFGYGFYRLEEYLKYRKNHNRKPNGEKIISREDKTSCPK